MRLSPHDAAGEVIHCTDVARPHHAPAPGHSLDEVEVLVEVVELIEVLLLHADAGLEEARLVVLLGVDDLVDHDVAAVDLELGELLDQALCLIEGKELGDADADECRQGRVAELVVDLQRGGGTRDWMLPFLETVALCTPSCLRVDLLVV